MFLGSTREVLELISRIREVSVWSLVCRSKWKQKPRTLWDYKNKTGKKSSVILAFDACFWLQRFPWERFLWEFCASSEEKEVAKENFSLHPLSVIYIPSSIWRCDWRYFLHWAF
jgi:hypothetical protein